MVNKCCYSGLGKRCNELHLFQTVQKHGSWPVNGCQTSGMAWGEERGGGGKISAVALGQDQVQTGQKSNMTKYYISSFTLTFVTMKAVLLFIPSQCVTSTTILTYLRGICLIKFFYTHAEIGFNA